MLTIDQIQMWQGQDLYDNDGSKIGEIVDIYVDRKTDQPEWLAVKTGVFGGKVNFVPLQEAHAEGDQLRVPYDKSMIKDAPNADPDGELSPEEERRLYQHYSVDFGDFDYDHDGDRDSAETTVGHDTSGPTTDNAMTRSEEEMVVGKTSRETGRARLRKYVVTENVQTTVPVQREEVRIEREPITDANIGSAMDGPAISEEEHEVTLHEEEPVVDKRVVPKERVRLDKETVMEDRQVGTELRKEEIDTDADAR